MMNSVVLIALALIELAMKIAPDVVQMVREIKKDKITLEDIRELRERIKPPDAYFEGGDGS
jgi:hypothetical protein